MIGYIKYEPTHFDAQLNYYHSNLKKKKIEHIVFVVKDLI